MTSDIQSFIQKPQLKLQMLKKKTILVVILRYYVILDQFLTSLSFGFTFSFFVMMIIFIIDVTNLDIPMQWECPHQVTFSGLVMAQHLKHFIVLTFAIVFRGVQVAQPTHKHISVCF